MKLFLQEEIMTKRIGEIIGERIFPGAVICLNGDLGAGKTTMTKSIAKAMGIDEDITSPTFTIVNEYTDYPIPLYHFDVYRIGSSDEMFDIGYDEYIESGGVVIIEWSNLIWDILPKDRLELFLTYDREGRSLEMIAYGDRHKKLIEEVVI